MSTSRLTRRATHSHPQSRVGRPTGTVPAPAGPPTRDAVRTARPAARHSAGRRSRPPAGVTAALRAAGQLDDRDHEILVMLDEHRALTTDQLARVFFPSQRSAQERLKILTERGMLARFRTYHPLGSLPYTYTLGHAGAVVRAAATDQPDVPTAARVATRIVRLVHSPGLAHLLGVNEFFTHLLAAARDTPSAALTEWWPEPTVAEACGGIVRPDGYGVWTQPATSVPVDSVPAGPRRRTRVRASAHAHADARASARPGGLSARLGAPGIEAGPDRPGEQQPGGQPVRLEFFFEHDRGSEPLDTLIAKLDQYEELAATEITATVLIQLHSPTREANLHDAIRKHYGQLGPRGVPVATTNTPAPAPRTTPGLTVIQHGPTTRRRATPHRPRPAGHPNPTSAVWRPLNTRRRYPLSALAQLVDHVPLTPWSADHRHH